MMYKSPTMCDSDDMFTTYPPCASCTLRIIFLLGILFFLVTGHIDLIDVVAYIREFYRGINQCA